MKNYTFRIFVDCSHFCFDLFLPRFRSSLFTFIKFSIYSKLLCFNPDWNSFNPGWDFSYNCNFFNSVYRVEISSRDENLHIISPFEYFYKMIRGSRPEVLFLSPAECEFWEIFKNNFFYKTPPVAASEWRFFVIILFYFYFQFILHW